MNATVRFADITTIGVGGVIHEFIEPTSPQEFIEVIERVDRAGVPLCVIGGGSNLLVGDDPFPGVVVRYAARGLCEVVAAEAQCGMDPATSLRSARDDGGGVTTRCAQDDVAESQSGQVVRLRVEAGCNWDDLVAHSIARGLSGLEGLSGIPGTVGASVVQNIGAYGQEVASSVEQVEVWDRAEHQFVTLAPSDLGFGYRTSALKRSMIDAHGSHDPRWYPTPRYVVLTVTFALHRSDVGSIAYGQLAHALGLDLGQTAPTRDIRAAVLRVRVAKGMLEDAHRYENPAMRGTKDADAVNAAIAQQADSAVKRAASGVKHTQGNAKCDEGSGTGSTDAAGKPDTQVGDNQQSNNHAHHQPEPYSDRHSCGSFFTNPILTQSEAASLPADAPRFEATLPDGSAGVKASAAWLIDHAGFHKGFALTPDARAGLSTRHTLALVNRGGATANDIAALATHIQQGVFERFGVQLQPEPIIYGLNL